MKQILLPIFACFIACTGYSQSSKTVFYKTLLELSNGNNDSIHYYLVKVKLKQNREIEKLDITFFKKDTIKSVQLARNPFRNSLAEIVADTAFDYSSIHAKDQIICPYIIKKVKFVRNPNTDPVFSAFDINRMFTLLKAAYSATRSKYILAKPVILFSEGSVH